MAIGHAFEDVLEVGEGLDVVELGGGMSEATIAQRAAPLSEPANRWFLRPRATGRMARSTVLLSSSMRPSSRKRQSACQRVRA